MRSTSFFDRRIERLLSDGAANANWSVRYPADPAISPDGPITLGGRLLGSLPAALADAPVEA